jgi:monoamine oxidase
MPGLQPTGVTPPDVAVQSCDVCIVGAGLAGLNALFASRYLSRDQKVILVDRRERVGGMWVDTYPYVRLHQPHPMFTAGNIAWTLGEDRSYLGQLAISHHRTIEMLQRSSRWLVPVVLIVLGLYIIGRSGLLGVFG